MPLLVPRLKMSLARAITLGVAWMGTQAIWLSQAYRLEFLGEAVFLHLWTFGLAYVIGHAWVLGEILDAYVVS